jgi:MoaA/NifB/PqqE/SkfB family radical SAM enzyme
MKLEDIGFYTLHDDRARTCSPTSDMQRCEILITGICNFKCPYCRGPRKGEEGHAALEDVIEVIDYWADDGLVNIRFSGGEPTTHPQLLEMVRHAKARGIKRIAISTNGSMKPALYQKLIDAGVNDFSISLDACCADGGDQMSGVAGRFNRVVENIRMIAAQTYVTVGAVITEENVNQVNDIIRFAHDLGVADIRIISAAQYNALLEGVSNIDEDLLEAHPILRYRVNNIRAGRNVRGLREGDSTTCHLAQDDSVVVGNNHYPCVIHMRERGGSIGTVGPHMREERVEWMNSHNPHEDPICRKNCLDVCEDYNNRVEEFRRASKNDIT